MLLFSWPPLLRSHSTRRPSEMFQPLPPDYSDRQTARCRISPSRFMQHAFSVGQWVTLESASQKVYCRVWPARYDCGDSILVDPYITHSSASKEMKSQIIGYSAYWTKHLLRTCICDMFPNKLDTLPLFKRPSANTTTHCPDPECGCHCQADSTGSTH